MFKRLLLYLIAIGILLSVAISAGQWDEGTTLLQEHADQISNYLGQQQTEGLAWLQDHRSDLENVLNNRPPANWSATLDQLAERDYTLLVHRADSLIFWSNTKALPVKDQLAMLAGLSKPTLVKMPLGDYVAQTQSFGNQLSTLLIPIRYAAGLQATHRESLFPADPNIPSQVEISTKSDFPIEVNGQKITGIAADSPIHSPWLQWVKLLFTSLLLAYCWPCFSRAPTGWENVLHPGRVLWQSVPLRQD